MSRPKLLLFDTGCVLEVMRQGLWRQLCEQYRVVVPSVVVRTEARYVDNVPGTITPIDLEQEVAAGRIEEYEGMDIDLQATLSSWPAAILERADAGEVEALTYLRVNGSDGVAFLTADGPAIQAAVALEVGHSAMSLEKLLDVTGCKRPGLEWRFTEAFVATNREKGVRLLLDSVTPPSSRPHGRGRRR